MLHPDRRSSLVAAPDLPPRASSFFAVDDHTPVFEPYSDSGGQPTSSPTRTAPNAPDFSLALSRRRGVNANMRPSRSSDDDDDEPDVVDIARDLEAVADHCDIAVPVLFSELRRTVSRRRGNSAPTAAAAAAAAPPAGESSPLLHQVESPPQEHVPSARIRVGSESGPLMFDLSLLAEAEAMSESVSARTSLPLRSLRSQASSSLPKTAPQTNAEPELVQEHVSSKRGVRFRGTGTSPPNSATPPENINDSFRNGPDHSDQTRHSPGLAVDTGRPETAEVERPRVRWAEEIRRVYSYQVDNSVFIAIEYARPLVGWLCLFFAVALTSFDGVLAHYYLASGVSPYASYAWNAIGQVFIALVVAGLYMFIVGGLTRTECRYLTSAAGWAQVGVVSFMFVMMALAEQAGSHMTNETRPFTCSAVHPLLIAGFGMVFKNTVFYEEIGGISVLLIGFGMAMLPSDLKAPRAYFAEVVYFSYGIFVASFLFACTRARARLPIPVLFLCLSVAFFIVQLPVCKLEEMDASPLDAKGGIFGFAHRVNVIPFVFATLCRSTAWILYLLALRFLPPVTVSAAMVIRPIVSAFGIHLAFQVTDDNGASIAPHTALGCQTYTAFWRFLSLSRTQSSSSVNLPPPPQSVMVRGEDSASFSSGSDIFFSDTPSPINSAAMGSSALFTPLFAVGAAVAVSATVYVIYISSIKRQKVELLLRLLSKRKRPRNPYSSRRPRLDPVRSFPSAAACRTEDSPRRATPDDLFPRRSLSPADDQGTDLAERLGTPRVAADENDEDGQAFTRPSLRTTPTTARPQTGSHGGSTPGRSPNRRSAPVLSTSPKYVSSSPNHHSEVPGSREGVGAPFSSTAASSSDKTAVSWPHGHDEYYDGCS